MNGDGAIQANSKRYGNVDVEWRREGHAGLDTHLSRISQYWTGKFILHCSFTGLISVSN